MADALDHAELIVVGSVLMEPMLVNNVVEKTDIKGFSESNGQILEAVHTIVRGVSERFKKINDLSVWATIQDASQGLAKVTREDIRKIVIDVHTTEEFDDALNYVADARIRDLSREAARGIQEITAKEIDLESVAGAFGAAQRDLYGQIERLYPQPTIADHLAKVEHLVQRSLKSGGEILGIPSGFPRLDFLTGGFDDDDYVLIAARPSMGKTAFALEIIKNNAKIYGKSCVIYSYEMSAVKLLERMVLADARVPIGALKRGKITHVDEAKIQEVIEEYKALGRIFIDDDYPEMDILESKIEMAREKHGASFIVIDYLQLIPYTMPGKSRQEEVSDISKKLKSLASRVRIPIVALSQLSRASVPMKVKPGTKPTSPKRPQMNELRESGALEQDADIIIFIHRPYYYGVREIDGKDVTRLAEIIVAKQRNGPTGLAEIEFDAQYARFRNPTTRWAYL